MAELPAFHPAVAAWFAGRFAGPTPAQALAWPAIAAGAHVLLSSPTGSGKTLSAFLPLISDLVGAASAGPRVLYISPIKALANDVRHNLLEPLAEIGTLSGAQGLGARPLEVALRTGDTPARERARIARGLADIIITTPESLYLMLTSRAAAALRGITAVIVDEIHALVPNERGAHLMMSLERLEALTGHPVQRIGLSATQRPLDEVAGFLGGDRPVTVLTAPATKAMTVAVEWHPRPGTTNAWEDLHPRLLELVRAHRSTLIFANGRRLAERIAGGLNELAGETLVHAHHGSVAKDLRLRIEADLKAGRLRGLVATSSLELGIDMGAIDLVVQVEAAPSVASALQRVGRAGHDVGGHSLGVILPKHRGDLVACAALARAMKRRELEAVRALRNPLDVLAQQLIATVAMRPSTVDVLHALVTRCYSFARLSRAQLVAVLDMLAGLHGVEALGAGRPRLTYDRVSGVVSARDGAARAAVMSGGTIADRGMYAVTAAGAEPGRGRIGELDEEMVLESKVGDVFVLGASSWRIDEITFDRVVVSPAPGELGRMPFWRGEQALRPFEFGQRIGALVREVRDAPRGISVDMLAREAGLDDSAAHALCDWLGEQAAISALPTDRDVVLEAFRDEVNDWRVCVLSPLGAQVLAPWAIVAKARASRQFGADCELTWGNDGFVIRLPHGAVDAVLPGGAWPVDRRAPSWAWLWPDPAALHDLVLAEVAGTSLFAARFREAASRALLLPRRAPGQRTPLWMIRKRAHDLLRAAHAITDFPLLVETYRKVMVDLFDVAGLATLHARIAAEDIAVHVHLGPRPSPFAQAVLFGYAAAFLYDGDVPAAERGAARLAIDPEALRELTGSLSLREVLEPEVLATVEESRGLTLHPITASPDAVHDLLLRLGDVSEAELATRCLGGAVPVAELTLLATAGRALIVQLGGARRWIPVEYAARYRDACGIVLPALAEALIGPVLEAPHAVIRRFAALRGPFDAEAVVARYGGTAEIWQPALATLVGRGELLEGAFTPRGTHREYIALDALAQLRARQRQRTIKAAEPVTPEAYARFLPMWHGVTSPRRGLDAVLDAVERLEGLAVPAALLERELLPTRVRDYLRGDLDTLLAAGELTWVGHGKAGAHDALISLWFADHAKWAPVTRRPLDEEPPMRGAIIQVLQARGALFYADLRAAVDGFPPEVQAALWTLVWDGIVSNDTLAPVRWLATDTKRAAKGRTSRTSRRGRASVVTTEHIAAQSAARGYRSRLRGDAGAGVGNVPEGRWRLTPAYLAPATATEAAVQLARRWLTRYGVVTRDVTQLEDVVGGFAGMTPVWQALEDGGELRRGNYVRGLAALQRAAAPVVDLLRAPSREQSRPLVLAAVDPANAYGALVPWPVHPTDERPRRAPGARVILDDGHLRGWVAANGKQLLLWGDGDLRAEAMALAQAARLQPTSTDAAMLEHIDGVPAFAHPRRPAFEAAGFVATPRGLLLRRS